MSPALPQRCHPSPCGQGPATKAACCRKTPASLLHRSAPCEGWDGAGPSAGSAEESPAGLAVWQGSAASAEQLLCGVILCPREDGPPSPPARTREPADPRRRVLRLACASTVTRAGCQPVTWWLEHTP